MKKLITLDLDGTLLTDEKRVLSQDIKTIEQWEKAGNTVIVATGRRYYSAKEILNDNGVLLPIISNNGSIIRDSFGKLLYRDTFEKNELQIILNTYRNFLIQPIFHVDAFESGYDLVLISDEYTPAVQQYCSDIEDRFRFTSNEEMLLQEKHLALVFVGELEHLKEYEKFLLKNYSHIFNVHVLENVRKNTGLLEVLRSKTNKWNSIYYYATLNSFAKKQIITVGDDNNDLSMILNSNYGIVMKNGSKKLLSIAKYISLFDNNEGGAIEAVNSILKDLNKYEY